MKAKVTNTYDRISIRVTDGDRSLTLGWSRYRDTCSGRGLAKPLMDAALPAFTRLRDAKIGGTLGERLARLESFARGCADLEAFVDGLYGAGIGT